MYLNLAFLTAADDGCCLAAGDGCYLVADDGCYLAAGDDYYLAAGVYYHLAAESDYLAWAMYFQAAAIVHSAAAGGYFEAAVVVAVIDRDPHCWDVYDGAGEEGGGQEDPGDLRDGYDHDAAGYDAHEAGQDDCVGDGGTRPTETPHDSGQSMSNRI